MSPAVPNGGWFNAAISGISSPPLMEDRKVASMIYPATATYADFYAGNVASISGQSRELSAGFVGSSLTFIYPDNLTTATQGPSDNHAKRGESVRWKLCCGNLGTLDTGAITISGTLSTSPTTMGALPFGSLSISAPGVPAKSISCTLLTSVVPATATIGTNYYIVFGSGTNANDIARVDRQLLIDP